MTSLGKNVSAGTVNADDVNASGALSVGGSVFTSNLVASNIDFGAGNNLGSLEQSGSMVHLRFEQMLQLTVLTTTAASDSGLFSMSGHSLQVGDIFIIDPSYDQSWSHAGLTVNDLVGDRVVTEVVNSTQVRADLGGVATTSGADLLTPSVKVAVYRFVSFDHCNPAAGWVTSTVLPTPTFTNSYPQLNLV